MPHLTFLRDAYAKNLSNTDKMEVIFHLIDDQIKYYIVRSRYQIKILLRSICIGYNNNSSNITVCNSNSSGRVMV